MEALCSSIKEKNVDQYSTRTWQKQYMKHIMSADILKHKQTFLLEQDPDPIFRDPSFFFSNIYLTLTDRKQFSLLWQNEWEQYIISFIFIFFLAMLALSIFKTSSLQKSSESLFSHVNIFQVLTVPNLPKSASGYSFWACQVSCRSAHTAKQRANTLKGLFSTALQYSSWRIKPKWQFFLTTQPGAQRLMSGTGAALSRGAQCDSFHSKSLALYNI